ncbi:hypothetical protein [Amaricoccus macauensis]|uniref:hypothetical protein n=1 Tax=Amaricoccus macauensis TaxID=57001 RepID=UPI003C79D13A
MAVRAEAFGAERRGEAALYGGIQSSQVWQDVVSHPDSEEFYDDGLIGISYAQFRPFGRFGIYGGVEAQANLHFGGQTYGEFNLPFVLRYEPKWSLPVRSFAYGLGPSLTTDVPDIEVDKGGASQRVLFYWYMEAEFGYARQRFNPFLRLHHRSNGFDTFEQPGSSNAIVLGLRRRY